MGDKYKSKDLGQILIFKVNFEFSKCVFRHFGFIFIPFMNILSKQAYKTKQASLVSWLTTDMEKKKKNHLPLDA